MSHLKNTLDQSTKTGEDIRQLVIARLKTLPSGKMVSIGSRGSFTNEELVKHVTNNDEIGKKITEVQLNFLRSLKDHKLWEMLDA